MCESHQVLLLKVLVLYVSTQRLDGYVGVDVVGVHVVVHGEVRLAEEVIDLVVCVCLKVVKVNQWNWQRGKGDNALFDIARA